MRPAYAATLQQSGRNCLRFRNPRHWRRETLTASARAVVDADDADGARGAAASHPQQEPLPSSHKPTSSPHSGLLPPPPSPPPSPPAWRMRSLPLPSEPAAASTPTTPPLLHPASNPPHQPCIPSTTTSTAAGPRLAGPSGNEPRPAVALALAAVALVALPLLQLLRHAELAAHGLTASLAAATGAAAAAAAALASVALGSSRRLSDAQRYRPDRGGGHGGFVMPLPTELALQPAAVLLLLLPLAAAAAAAAAWAVGGGGGAAAAAEAHSDAAAARARSAAGTWLRAAALYAAALLVPSPGPRARVAAATAGGKALSRLHGLFRILAGQGLRVLLLGCSWAAVQAGQGPAWVAATWATAAGAFWALHTAGVLAVVAAEAS